MKKSITLLLIFTILITCISQGQQNNTKFKDGSITYYEKSQIRSGELNGNQTIQGINFRNWSTIYFYPNGKIKGGYLNGNRWLRGYARGQYISFDTNGDIITNP